MPDKNNAKANDKPFIESIKRAGSDKNYLGDREVIESLLRFYVSTLIDNLEDTTTDKQRIKEMQLIAKEVANILLGYDHRKYAKVRKWNRPGGIDVFLAKWLGLAEKDPSDRLEYAFIMLFDEVADIAVFAGEPGALEEQWQPAFDAVIERYTDLCLGLDPVTKMIIT